MKIDTGQYWKDWEVYLTDSDGNRLPEHKIEHTPPTPTTPGVVNLHVECQHDQAFTICAARPAPALFDSSVTYSIDGREVQGRTFFKDVIHPATKNSLFEDIGGVPIERPLTFSPMQMVENGPILDNKAAETLGTICVTLTAGVYSRGQDSLPWTSPPSRGVLDERSKKGMIGTFVGGKPGAAGVVRETYNLAPFTHIPKYKITFSYARRDLLMAKGVIERPRVDIDIEDELQEVKPKLKRRHSDDKPQRWSKRNKEVIDLTEDD